MIFSRSYKFILTFLTISLFASCYPWHSSSLSDVTSAEKKLQEAKQVGKLDSTVINKAINAYQFFIAYFPYDSLTPGFIVKEGELYKENGDYSKSISILKLLQKLYPKSHRVSDGVFLMATVYEQNLKNQDSADTLYATLLFNYPDSKAAQQTHSLLESKGISSEDFYKKYAGLFTRLENSSKTDSTKIAVRYHAYWKHN